MDTKQELQQAIATAKTTLADAKSDLLEWQSRVENNVFQSMEDAESDIEDALMKLARDACEGAYNCGATSYTREFMVDGKVYVGTLTLGYNRHDKTYYYIDEHEFSVIEKVVGAAA